MPHYLICGIFITDLRAEGWALPTAGENKALKRKTAEAQEKSKKRAETQPFIVYFVSSPACWVQCSHRS